MSDFYQQSAMSLRGQEIDFNDYRGQTVLVVNTASLCVYTSQYSGLEALYQKYKDQGLVILGFPCNQFGQQEPGSAEEIAQTCQINYGVSFPMFAKVDVNGAQAHPLFRWLKAKLPGWFGRRIHWNFTKFLIGRDGQPIKRFGTLISPERMEATVRKALAQR